MAVCTPSAPQRKTTCSVHAPVMPPSAHDCAPPPAHRSLSFTKPLNCLGRANSMTSQNSASGPAASMAVFMGASSSRICGRGSARRRQSFAKVAPCAVLGAPTHPGTSMHTGGGGPAAHGSRPGGVQAHGAPLPHAPAPPPPPSLLPAPPRGGAGPAHHRHHEEAQAAGNDDGRLQPAGHVVPEVCVVGLHGAAAAAGCFAGGAAIRLRPAAGGLAAAGAPPGRPPGRGADQQGALGVHWSQAGARAGSRAAGRQGCHCSRDPDLHERDAMRGVPPTPPRPRQRR